jgi:putative FmdB family regulatory protein
MPFYEYQCGQCDHRLEVLQKISDDPLVYCPECNEASLKKLISAAAFRLKGTGWYETDFKNNDKKKEKSESKTSDDSSSSSKSPDSVKKTEPSSTSSTKTASA